MSPKHRTGYGVFDLTRQIARRIQQEWDAVENPPLPPLAREPHAPVVIPFPRPRPVEPPFKRPIAA